MLDTTISDHTLDTHSAPAGSAMAAPLYATDFLRLHGPQLDPIGFPHSLLPTLQCKLQGEGVFDAGSAFQVNYIRFMRHK